jgi:serine/threonine-protein kinase
VTSDRPGGDDDATLPPGPSSPGTPSTPPSTSFTSSNPSTPGGTDPGGTGGLGGSPGQVIGGRFEILALLGTGGMGSVYKALDRELGEPVALKMLRADLVASPARLERLRQEARLARRVTHASIARTFDIGEHGQARFLTMEFIDGQPLTALLARHGALPVERVVAVVSPICAGLAAAHAVGVVHRDLKPDNILLGKDGRVVITDFGIAHEAGLALEERGGLPVGTPSYMAPEQVQGGPVDARTDLYALGVMLFEMLTGERPWRGSDLGEVLQARLNQPPPDPRSRRPGIVAEAALLVMRCMATRPADRPASAAEVGRALLPLAQGTLAPEVRLTSSTLAPAAATPTGAAAAAGTTATAGAAREPMAVAVLPFRNAGQAGDEHWADGFTEDVIETLSLVPGLRVQSRGRVMALKQSELDPCALGRQLDVHAIVEGSVRRHHGKVRVQARLVSVNDGFQVWAQRFDRPEADLLDVTDEVAAAIAAGLVKPEPAQRPGGVTGFRDGATLELYLRARQAHHEASPEGMQHARQLFEQALANDPEDPRLLAGHALTLSRVWLSGNFRDLEALAGQARSEAVQALQRGAPAEAHLALAVLHNQDMEVVQAATEVTACLQKAPLMAEAYEVRGRLLSESGAFDEALASFEQATQHEPAVQVSRIEMARIHALRGDLARCHALLGSLMARPPLLLLRMRVLLWQGEEQQARQLVQAAAATTPLIVRLGQALFDGDIGAPGKRPRREVFFRQLHCEYLAATGRAEEALRLIEEAVGHGLNDVGWLDACPVLGGVRQLPGYAPVHERVGRIALQVRQRLLGPA